MEISLATDSSFPFMVLALDLARQAGERGEVPVGAVIVDSRTGQPIASAANHIEAYNASFAHAEFLVIEQATQSLGSKWLSACDLYVTLEPCALCAGAISLARIRRLYFGAYDPKSGAVEHGAKVFDHRQTHHKPEVYGGILESEASALLSAFFAGKR